MRRKSLIFTAIAAGSALLWTIPGLGQGISGYISGLLSTGGNPGPVPYASAPGVLGEDASNFCWDATHHRLGIGTCTPGQSLDVTGQVYARTALFTNQLAGYSSQFLPVAGELVSAGSTPSMSGCSATSQAGGYQAGKYVSGTTGTCTVTMTVPTASNNGWSCTANDLTTTSDAIKQTASTTTTYTLSGTTISGDVINFACWGY